MKTRRLRYQRRLGDVRLGIRPGEIEAATLVRHSEPSLFAIGAAAVLLLFVGIHNAWDAVIYIAQGRRSPRNGER